MARAPEASTSNSYSATRSPSITFGVSPVENDVIVIHVGSIGTAALTGGTEPTGWENCLADNSVIEPGDASVYEVILYHIVTAAEDSANQVTWTLTNLWANTETGDVTAGYWRGVDTTSVIDAFASASDAGAVTPHVLPAVTGTDITTTGGWVIRGIAKDSTGTYTTPGGHTQIVTTNTNHGLWLGYRDTDATASTNITAQNITPSASDEYVSFTIVLRPASSGTPESVTEDDPVGITDTADISQGNAIEEADDVGITDAADLSVGEGHEEDDPIGITDSADIVLTEAEIVDEADDIGITDTVDVISGLVVTAEDDIGITDSITLVVDNVLSFTDPIGIDDSVIGFDVELVTVDGIGITDSVSTSLAGADSVSPADNLGITEDVLLELEKFLSTDTDEVGITDSVTVVLGLAVVATDTLGIDDTVETGIETATEKVDICLTVGPPTFVSRTAGVTMRSHTATVVVRTRSAGAPSTQSRIAAVAAILRSVTHAFRSRAAGVPTLVDRDATLAFREREADVLVSCEEV